MVDGAVMFRGNSTISRTRAVRPARRTGSHADTHLEYWCAALAPALAVGDSQIEQECAVVVLVK